MAKRKTPQNSQPSQDVTESKSHGEYLSLFNFKRTPYTSDTLRLWAEEYHQWALTESKENPVLVLEDFPLSKGIPLSTWYRWLKLDHYLSQVHPQVRKMIGSRREKKAFLNQASASIFLISAPAYDYSAPEYTWQELLEMKAKLAENQITKTGITVIEVPSYLPAETAKKVTAQSRRGQRGDAIRTSKKDNG